MYRYTFTEVATLAFKVWRHVIQITNQKNKQKWTTLSRKACYRPNYKPSKYPSKRIDKHEIWHTHLGDFENYPENE